LTRNENFILLNIIYVQMNKIKKNSQFTKQY